MGSAPRPVAADRLASSLASIIVDSGARRVAIDGHPATGPGALADELIDPLRLLSRPVLRVPADGFLRPASLRLERGRTDPDAFYDDRLDVAALRREVLDPLGPSGSGSYLPSLWDPVTDRATRASYVPAPPAAVLVVDGTLLLGQGLPFDLTVHLWLSSGARSRRTDPSFVWTLPAYDRYEQEVGPASVADVVVRSDDPRHPALSCRTG